MPPNQPYLPLTEEQINQLTAQGCSAEDWLLINVDPNFNPARVKNAHFSGPITIGRMDKKITLYGGLEQNTGIYHANIHNCRIGDNVYINNVESYIANFHIDHDVIIDHITLLAVEGPSSFGNGVEINVINEVGGREIPIYDRLSSQIAYLLALYRHNPTLISQLKNMIAGFVASVTSDMGHIAPHVKIINCGAFKNVKIGPHALLEGVTHLENGSINSCPEDPSFMGANVIAHDFILSSGARVRDGAIINRCFIGQGTDLAKQYSAENSAFFANCGGYHGEACSVFAGPYTVTHHKSTLLIAGLYSFLNAGSGSNQSNHMYKLGPVHQGIVERGSKTTSDSYILWPAKIGPFTLIMGRHYDNCDTSDLPFSYLIESEGKSVIVPGMNLRTVGTVRDARKWPQRDRRRDPCILDLLTFNLLTPYTVQKMINGRNLLTKLKNSAQPVPQTFHYHGVKIKRASLKSGIKLYQMGIDRYLGNVVVRRLRQNHLNGMADLQNVFAVDNQIGRGRWLDLAGMITPEENIIEITTQISHGYLNSLEQINHRLREVHQKFFQYEWNWVLCVLEQNFNKSVHQFSPNDVIEIIRKWIDAVEQLDHIRMTDSHREFDVTAQIGFGIDGAAAEKESDFLNTRGAEQDNSFMINLQKRLEQKKKTADELIEKLQKLT